MSAGTVTYELMDRIAVITISQPGRLNAWNREMRDQLLGHLKTAASGSAGEVAGIVIQGDGDAFCSGQDLTEAMHWDGAFADVWVREFKVLYDAVRSAPQPVVAAVKRVAAGSGFQFALCCDLLVSHATARLGQPEVRSGLASVTGAWLIREAVGSSRMKEMVLSAELIDGTTAHDWGIVNELADEDAVLDRAIDAARRLAEMPGQSFALTKQALVDLTRDSYDRAFDIAVEIQSKVYDTGESADVMAAFTKR